MKEAIFYKPLPGKKVQCTACNRFCAIEEGAVGNCRVRKNIDGKLFSLTYNRTLTQSIDPVEKKPFFHFKPGSLCTGVSTYGCNFHCLNCQNANISQEFTEQSIEAVRETTPEQITEGALDSGVSGIAYTYTEPTVFSEYALDTMKLARKKKIYNVWVSNGYMSKELAESIAPFLDAINIDLKGDEKVYREICGNAHPKPVKENIVRFHSLGVHVEATNLIVPGYNDSEKHFRETASFIAEVDKKIPLHFSRFFPHFQMTHLPPTDISKLEFAKKIALEEGLKFVYLGNLGSDESTICPECNAVLVKRIGYASEAGELNKKGNCKKCRFETGVIV